MSSEYAVGDLVTGAAGALYDGRRVSIRLSCDLEWMEVSDINTGKYGMGIVHVTRAADGHTILIPASRVAAIDLGRRGSGGGNPGPA